MQNKENDNIVISGIAGKFPQCRNVEEFKEALLNGVDLVTENDERYPKGIWGIPTRSGVLLDTEKFDATYFNIHSKQATAMDPRQRILLETVYECIIDAGYNPKELRGSKIGVYVAITLLCDTQKIFDLGTAGYATVGMCLALAANRISSSFHFTGPSYAIDTACSSSLYAFVSAMNDINLGEADAAIVCGTHLLCHPSETLEFHRMQMLSQDGKCRVYSSERAGYARSETISCCFLQKESVSRRIYATVLGAKRNTDGYKKEGITFPSVQQQFNLINDLYRSINLDSNSVSYIEAHGTGTLIGDVVETEAISKYFCKNRKEPLLIGGVKSNMGHSEVGAGMCSLAKVIIAMETGIIPANLNYDPIDYTLPGIKDGTLQVVTENKEWKVGNAAINCFGFGGANAHIALKPFQKEKKVNNYPKYERRLVMVSGRTEEAVGYFLDGIEKHQHDPEFLALVDEIHKTTDDGHHYRGYVVLGEKSVREITRCDKPRPVWFVFTGMGSQWNKMGKDLMNNKIFKEVIHHCAEILAPYGVDLLNILLSEDPAVFDDVTNAFCGIICVEIAITAILKSLDIVPDGICGHSVGEVGCGYADGSMTVAEGVMVAYSRGYASTHCDIIPGQMAAVGLPKDDLLKRLPEGVFIACHNAKGSYTISGPKEKTIAFVNQLNEEGIFAKLVKSANIAYHTKYISEAGKVMLEMAKKFLKDSRPRSSKWVSSSVPPDQQNEPWAKLNCAEYHHNNFCRPVLFEQVYEHIPKNAIVLEIAPHGLLQAILKKEMSSETTNIPLTNRWAGNNESFFLEALGKLYLAGGQLNLRKLYDDVTLPVSRGTKMLSDLVKWDHSTSWLGPKWEFKGKYGKSVKVNLSEDKYAYLAGHDIDGRVLMPATGYLDIVWQTLADLLLVKLEELPVVFENVKFKRATVLNGEEGVTFLVNIMCSTGHFEITETNSTVCTGVIRHVKDIAKEFILQDLPVNNTNDTLKMKREDVYKECYLRRYLYKDVFQGVIEGDIYGLNGKIEWKENFCSFLDTMLHLVLISSTSRNLMLPTAIQQLIIDPVKHLQITEENPTGLDIGMNKDLNIVKSGGIEIIGLECSAAPRRQNIQDPPYLETYEFVPYEITTKNQYNLDSLLTIATQIVIQNNSGQVKYLNVCEITTNENDNKIIDIIQNILDNQALTNSTCTSSTFNNLNAKHDVIVICEEVLPSVDFSKIEDHLKPNGFILYKGDYDKIQETSLQLVFQSATDEYGIYLLRPTYDLPKNWDVVNIRTSDFDWLETVKAIIEDKNKEGTYLWSQNEYASGIIGFVKCLLSEPISVTDVKAIFIDQSADKFSINDKFYQDQLKKNLNYNVLKNNKWGTYVHLPMSTAIENQDVESATVTLSSIGDLASLQWIQRPSTGLAIFDDSELVYVYYSALNFRDIMVATGKLQLGSSGNIPSSLNHSLGLEYSGITTHGKRVMGMVGGESIGLQVFNDPYFTWEVPKNWSLQDACTIPCVYATCYYGMIIRGQMKPGESILIHAGTGGVGLAAINIALSLDCEVFTTVSTNEKREFLKTMFPKLKDQNIGNSRNKSFEKMIKINTKGRGVDLVLNSLADELYQASMRCLAPKGRFLEIGKVDLTNSSPIPSPMFLNNISFHGVHLDKFFYPQSDLKKEIHKLVAEGIANGVVKPLPTMVFSETEVESAFRCLASGKHRGKVLIEVRKEEASTKLSRTISAAPRIYFDPEKSYILVGGLGGFGLELADWIISKGGTKVVLNSRREISNGYQAYCLRKWSEFEHITVKINTSDTSTLEGAEELIRVAQKLGPVGGIFNMALVLRDALFSNQTSDNFTTVFKTKISSGQNLDIVSRKLCKHLDHFVVMSSIACGRGNAGQTNYGMSNSALEILCERRKEDNLPGLAIQWGPIGDVGVLAKSGNADVLLENIRSQRITSCLDVLEKSMLSAYTVTSSLILSKNKDGDEGFASKSTAEVVARILGIKDLSKADKSISLSELGLDSLMLTEIKQSLYRNFEIDLEPEEIPSLTLDSILKMDPKYADSNKDIEIKSEKKLEVQDSQEFQCITLILAEKDIVKMNNSTEFKNNIFLLHSFEGHVILLEDLAQELRGTIYGVQCTSENIFRSVSDYAEYFINKMKEIQPKGPYYICGYSYGGLLGVEISLQLQKLNEEVKLICIDGSPAFVKNILEYGHLVRGGSYTESARETLYFFCKSFTEISSDQAKEFVKNLEGSVDESIESVSEDISKITGIDKTKIMHSANAFIGRALAGKEYEPTSKIKSKILLIRRQDNPFISEDYNLNEVCEQTVEIKKIPGSHQSVILGENAKKVAKEVHNFFKI